MRIEGVASEKLRQELEYARVIRRAFGHDDGKPSVMLTDNVANKDVAASAASAARSKHCLRMYKQLQQSQQDGNVVMQHVTDAENPADFLPKWVGAKKLKRSLAFATGSMRLVKR